MNASQIANRLTIPESSSGFQVIEFPTPSSGLSTPLESSSPGFIRGGTTRGGAREFNVPNQPIPAISTTRIVK
jgi:hypothetical protein